MLSHSSLMINLECVCSGKNKQSKWSLSPIWALEFHFPPEWKLLLANRGFFILSLKKWISFYQTSNLYIYIYILFSLLWSFEISFRRFSFVASAINIWRGHLSLPRDWAHAYLLQPKENMLFPKVTDVPRKLILSCNFSGCASLGKS